MFKRALATLIFLFTSFLANAEAPNPCIQNIDKKIGTLYLCGFGGQFKVLSLERCDLKNSDIPAVVKFLTEHPRVNALDVGQNKLTNVAALKLAQVTTLAWLNFSYNSIGGTGITALASMPLTHLELISDQVGDDGLSAFENNTHLQSLELSFNRVTSIGAASLAKINSLRILTLDFNRVDDAAVKLIADMPALTHLYLRSNYVTDEGVVKLAENPNLLHLSLIANRISDTGALALAKTTHIQWLYLDDNQISSVGIEALNNNPTFIDVTTSGNNGEKSSVVALNKYLSPLSQGKSQVSCER